MTAPVLESTLPCPHCGHKSTERCPRTRAYFSMSAQAVVCCCVRIRVTVVCSAPTEVWVVLLFNSRSRAVALQRNERSDKPLKLTEIIGNSYAPEFWIAEKYLRRKPTLTGQS